MKQRQILLTHKNITREFIISNSTKPNTFKNLIKKAFHLQIDVKSFKAADYFKISFEELITSDREGEFQIVLEDESWEQKSKSQVCSQKNMSKISGRKNPPSEKELLDSKFYIDDFQLFMSQVSAKKSKKWFGIVFFNSKKKASFLGKKILRELIFEFDKIEFFYALHPIKMHTTSALLGEVCIFSLFRGKQMMHEREFPEQITAADEIPNYVKNLIKIGKINFDQSSFQVKKPKNLIFVHQQRSFDDKIQNSSSPDKTLDFKSKPNRTAEIIKMKPVTPQKQLRNNKIFLANKNESPIRSQITNEISFENDFYQPDWFFQGNALSRLEKGFLSTLIKANDQSLLSFLNGLNLKSSNKQKLNINLMKVFLKEIIDEKLTNFNQKQKKFIQSNQQNRKSIVFSCLLKLFKFGDIKDFLDVLERCLPQEQLKEKRQQASHQENIQYSNIARINDKQKSGFTIKLLDCGNQIENASPRQHPSPFREDAKVHNQHILIAKNFHQKYLEIKSSHIFKNIEFTKDYDEADRASIQDLILKNDAFLIENFVPNPFKHKKVDKLPAKLVKYVNRYNRKYMRQIETRYEQIRQRTVIYDQLNLKMQKLQIFNGLLYYLYLISQKQRMINKKQLKISFYLYTWSDLNILSSFEVYLQDRDLDEFVDTLYAIDYNYYLNEIYEIDHTEVEQFNKDIEIQLIILFLYEGYIESTDERMSLEKFIRAGDKTVINLYLNLKIDQNELIKKLIDLTKLKKQELDNIHSNDNIKELSNEEKKKERSIFVDQILAARFKTFTKKDKLKYLINHNEPLLKNMFDLLDQNGDQGQWINSFSAYLQTVEQTHMKMVIEQLALQGGLDTTKIYECRLELIKGIYENHLLTNDSADSIDTLERAIRKLAKSRDVRGSPK